MGERSYVQTDFRGGLWSPSAQGMMGDPEYARALNECLNSYPIEQGAWVRRPPFYQIGYTRFGAPAKLLSLSGATKNFYNMELSAGHLRFIQGAQFVTDATRAIVTNLSSTNPCVMTIDADKGWATGDQVIYQMQDNAIRTLALLTHRTVVLERVTGTTYALHDLLTGKGIDGALMSWDSSFIAFVGRITDLSTPYYGTMWKSVKRVQTDRAVLLLHPAVWPQLVTYQPAADGQVFASAGIKNATFADGPYLDPEPNSIATPTGTTGLITLAFSFAAYDATVAYDTGDYATYGSFHWKSLQDQNINNTPADGSAFWVRSSALDFLPKHAFSPTDIGRHIRLLSEPADWASGTTYSNGNVVKHNGTYWIAIATAVGAGAQEPGNGVSYWAPYASGARWTWGKITATSGGTPITGTAIGNMTGGPGLAALFDGSTNTQDTQSANHKGTSAYVGLNMGATAVTSATLWPSRNAKVAGGSGSTGTVTGGTPVGTPGTVALGVASYSTATGQSVANLNITNPPNPSGSNGGAVGSYTFAKGEVATVTVNLRAKNSLPGSASDGTLLGTTGTIPASAITGAPVQVVSNDATTTWTYVWFEILISPSKATATHYVVASEATFYSAGLAGNGLTVQLLGKPLLYSAAINTWRLGRFNDTDPAYPTAGCFAEGRVWLATGTNHFDASQPLGDNNVISFAPTEEDGTVTDASAISYTFNSALSAPSQWMLPTDGGIVLGSSGDERLLFSTTQDQAMTPTNINVELKTSYGSSDIEPQVTPLTSIFVHANGRDIHEYMRDAYSGRFVIPPLTEFSKSLTDTGLVQLTYQRAITPIIWACTQDGRLIGSTYERLYLPFRSESPPKYNGFHHHTHGADRDFQSVSVGPSIDGSPVEALAVITRDRETGYYRVEVSGPLMPENNDIYDCNFLDGMYVPQNLGIYVEAPSTPDIVPPPPPPPPGVFRWVVPGYTLSSQCPAIQVSPVPGYISSNCVHPAANAEPGVDASQVWLTPPTSQAFGGCPFYAFTPAGTIPGVNTSPTMTGQPFTISQYSTTVFGDDKWFRYQLWLPNSPSSVPSQPVWTDA